MSVYNYMKFQTKTIVNSDIHRAYETRIYSANRKLKHSITTFTFCPHLVHLRSVLINNFRFDNFFTEQKG